MASFHAKIGWKRPRKRKNKNYRSVPFRSYTTHNRKFQKNSKKIKKTKQYHYGFISSQNKLEKAAKEKKCKFSFRSVPFRSYTTRNTKFQKNSKKIQKTKQYHYGFISSQNKLEKAAKEKKYKFSFRFVPTRPVIENSKKIGKKFKKLKHTIMAPFQAKIG